jgi:hypothetical protein
VEAVLAGSADMPLQMLLASRRAGHCSPWQAAVSQHHAVPLLPTCHAGLHRLSVVLLCWNDSAVAMPGTLRPPAAASRQEGPKRRSIEQQMGTAGSGERRLKTQGWDGVSSSVQRPHLRAACCGSRSRARCRRRPPTFAAPSAAELPPPGSPAAVPRAGAGADESAAQHEHWALQHHAPNQSVVPPEKPAAVQAVPTWRCPVAWEREKPSRSGGAPRRRTHQVRSSRAWREGQKRGAIHGNSEGWCIRA